jgi:mevalonate kinase
MAPAKVILFGEHAVNRGQTAIAAAVDLRTECRLTEAGQDSFEIAALGERCAYSRRDLLKLAMDITERLAANDHAGISSLQQRGALVSLAFVLGSVLRRWEDMPGVSLVFEGEIPVSCGLGSGAAAHVSASLVLAAYISRLHPDAGELNALASEWAFAGDRVSHGGTASALDTQTSLLGGIVEFRQGQPGLSLTIPTGLRLVVGHTGIPKGSTGSVNARVRQWLVEKPIGEHYFREMGLLARYARIALEGGQWEEVGALMNLNHLLLRRIGATHPDLERLCQVALEAGAFGAKLTGAGGGGCMVALVDSATEEAVAAAIAGAGGTSFRFPVAVSGGRISSPVPLGKQASDL